MARHVSSSDNPSKVTVVAIDRDKNSASAVKWAIDNLVISHPTLVLLHVKNPQNHSFSANGAGATDSNNGSHNNYDVQQIFKPSRVYCARKGITAQEIFLEHVDVSKAILEYVNENHVANLVLGSSGRNVIARKFWTNDVPTILNKAVPDFCSVYVIAKGKIESIRYAARSASSSATPQRQKSPRSRSPLKSDHHGPHDVSRAKLMRGEKKSIASERVRSRIGSIDGSTDIDISFIASSNSTNRSSPFKASDFSTPFPLGSVGAPLPNLEIEKLLESVENVCHQSAPSELEAEMKRLKLELKETLDKYNTACRDAISAKQKAEALQQLKLEDSEKCDRDRVIGEATSAVAQVEKTKYKAAYEAAEKAQRLAEIEGHRRKYAEEQAEKEAKEKDRALTVLSQSDVRYRRYTIEEIEDATDKFSSAMKIGEGGYGPVYKAKLDHTPVAIKVLRSDEAQGRKQFQQEIEVLCSIRHPNLVLLLGACPEFGCLVYEFMSNGSLEDRLFRKGNSPPIPWRIRFKLAADIATALLFLHQTRPEPLVHRDLKPANILLDHYYVCKISDVGLSRLVPPSVADSVSNYHMTSAAGTFCYIDPEYQQTGELGTKSDIYSLGVMLLQVITARPPMGLTHHVERAIKAGNFADLLDPTVQDWPVEEAFSFAKLALKCVELRKKDRPDLGSVIVPELCRLKEIAMSSS
ncbi:hypothetical protein M9H77_19524 [Catharanthus roseus]|uniref:Uncharacterized protein n=2 Tax=Catharanthus roseus TaxID=4058 RepID=A0ACC0BAK0_CATRO|nr:putative universal stress protein [Catharanthus roseus]KAI5669671.1 hypothetical protein M9H77_19524 [Catharanthus roseus]